MPPHRPTSVPPSVVRYAVVGTAGHIDHGKSALVRALTGTDPDRLEEEQRRGMTIDLGFAHFDLPSGVRVGIVDVPGHERLVKTMLAGAAGVDLVLLVVAADEGIMPQTREHLDILRFLRVRRGIVVLTKIDLVPNVDWLALVREEIAGLVRGTFLEGAPVIQVSARTGAGLGDLVSAIDRAFTEVPRADPDAPVRLPVDRSFTMTGFGTVATGTLWAGRVRAGDVLTLLPSGREVRVRQVQSHGQVVVEASAGQRAALNLVGVAKDDVTRGNVLVAPGTYRPSRMLDVRLRLLGSVPSLRHHDRIRLYLAADEVIGRVRLLDRDVLVPGGEAPAQLRLERETVAARGDPFVIRRYSPMTTVGGGEIIAVDAPTRRRGAATAAAIISDAAAGFDTRVRAALETAGRAGTTVDEAARSLDVTKERVAEQFETLARAGRLLEVRGRFFSAETADEIRRDVLAILEAHHTVSPWRGGMPREDLKRRAFPGGDDRFYGAVLESLAAAGEILVDNALVRLAAFTPARTAAEQAAAETIAGAYLRGRFMPPAREEGLALFADRGTAERMFQALLDDGTLVDAGGIVFHRDAVAEIEARAVAHLRQHGELTVAALRDLLGSSRKYVLAALEYLDARRVTRRTGDKRVLARPADD